MNDSDRVNISINLGTSVKSAEEAARELSRKLYPLLPIDDSRGQSAKNAFVKAWFNRSERSERAARARFGLDTVSGGDVKPVINDQWNPVEEDFSVDFEAIADGTVGDVTVTCEDDGTIVIVVPPQS